MESFTRLQRHYAARGYRINYRAGTYYITRMDKPLIIIKRFTRAAVNNIDECITLLNNYIKELGE